MDYDRIMYSIMLSIAEFRNAHKEGPKYIVMSSETLNMIRAENMKLFAEECADDLNKPRSHAIFGIKIAISNALSLGVIDVVG